MLEMKKVFLYGGARNAANYVLKYACMKNKSKKQLLKTKKNKKTIDKAQKQW